jgi:hypothetical protein
VTDLPEVEREAFRRAADPEGLELIAAEREGQVNVEVWTPEHDDTHRAAELSRAAMAYASIGNGPYRQSLWPWDDGWKPASIKGTCADDPSRVRDLVKAGALIITEIKRLRRVERAASDA